MVRNGELLLLDGSEVLARCALKQGDEPATDGENIVKAIVQEHYGSAKDVLEFRETEQPTAKDDEVLLRVHAASIHAGDCLVMQGLPKVMRPVFGLRRPKHPVPGA